MMRIFTDDGDAVPVTVLDVSNNRVTQIKTPDNDGYCRVQVAFGKRAPRASTSRKPAISPRRASRPVKSSGNSASARSRPPTSRPARRSASTCSPSARWSTCRARRSARASPAPSSATTSVEPRVARQLAFAQRAGLDRHGAGPGPRVPGQEDVGPPGRRERTTQNLDVVRIDASAAAADPGAVPGAKAATWSCGLR